MSDDAIEEEAGPPAPLVVLDKSLRFACHSIRAVALIWVVWSGGLALWIWSDRAAMLDRWAKLYGLDPATVSDAAYWSSMCVILVIWAVSWSIVYYLWRLTRSYLDGRVFTVEAAGQLRAVALAGFAATAVSIVGRPIQVMLISSSLLAKLPLYAWLQPADLLYLLISGFVLALGVIFEAAAEIASDHARIV